MMLCGVLATHTHPRYEIESWQQQKWMAVWTHCSHLASRLKGLAKGLTQECCVQGFLSTETHRALDFFEQATDCFRKALNEVGTC